MAINSLAQPTIIGAGVMGHALAADLASHGFPVTLHSRSQESLDKGMAAAAATLQRLQALGVLSPE